MQTIQRTKKENTSPKKKKKMLPLRKTINWLQSYHFHFYFLWEDNIVFYIFIFFIGSLVYFKKTSCPVCGDTWVYTSVLLCLPCLFSSLILLHRFALILPGTHSPSHEKKKGDKVCIFSCNHIVWMFDILNEHGGIHQFSC